MYILGAVGVAGGTWYYLREQEEDLHAKRKEDEERIKKKGQELKEAGKQTAHDVVKEGHQDYHDFMVCESVWLHPSTPTEGEVLGV